MQIKKIDTKLSFDVEAQAKCPHGKSMLSRNCKSDCKTLAWTGSNAVAKLYSSIGSLCKSTSTYTCYFAHIF